MRTIPIDNADDSSDEEESAKPLGSPRNYKKHIEDRDGTEEKIIKESDPELYSFRTFNLALGQLYSPKVNEYYYQKKKALPQTTLTFDSSFLEDFLFERVSMSLSHCFIVANQENFCVQVLKQFLGEHETKIREIIRQKLLKEHLRVFFIQIRSKGASLSPAIEKCLSEIKILLLNFIDRITDIQPDPAPWFNYMQHFDLRLAKRLIFFYEQKAYARNGKFVKIADRKPLINPTPAEQVLVLHSKSFYSQNKVTAGAQLFQSLLALETNEKDSCIEAIEINKLMYYRFKPGITKPLPLRDHLTLLFDEGLLSYYLPVALETILTSIVQKIQIEAPDEFSRYFLGFITENDSLIQDHLLMQRGLPEQQYKLTNHNISEHLANIRLSMRIQRRRIRQLFYEDLFEGEEFQLAWEFYDNRFLVLENQTITKHKARKDLVQHLGSYKDIFTTLERWIINLNISLNSQNKPQLNDIRLAIWIRDILIHGAPFRKFTPPPPSPKLKFDDFSERQRSGFIKFLLSFTYLLFGCEVQRNPTSLITHQMLLDLIIAGQMSWKQAIADPEYSTRCGGGALPMSMGAYKKESSKPNGKTTPASALPVASARLFAQRYNEFSVKKWIYEGRPAETTPAKETAIKEFIEREHELINKWVLFKAQNAAGKEFHFETEVRAALQNWYPSQP